MATWNVTAARGKKARQTAKGQTQPWDGSVAWMATETRLRREAWDGLFGWDGTTVPGQKVSRGKKAVRTQMEEQVQTVAWDGLLGWDGTPVPGQKVSRGKKAVRAQMEEQIQTVKWDGLLGWDRGEVWEGTAVPVQKVSRGKMVEGQATGWSSSAANLWYGATASVECGGAVENFKCSGRGTLRLLQVNCRSIRTKALDLNTLIDVHRPDVIIGTESWLKKDDRSSKIFHPDFVTHRRDRIYGAGGGIFICVNKNLRVSEVSADKRFEILSVKLRDKTLGNNVSVIAAYRAPKENFQFVQKLVELTRCGGRGSRGKVIIGGDLNLPDVCWEGSAESCSAVQALVNELVWANALAQVVREPTRAGALLDVFLVRPQELVLGHEVVSGISDHKGVLLHVKWRDGNHSERSSQQLISRNAIEEQDLNDINDLLKEILHI